MKVFALLSPTIRNSSTRRLFSATPHRDTNIAIAGGGAAGFYTAARLLSKTTDTTIDIFEQLPTPHGLVRYGVAPDHPEVKNCMTKFDQVSGNPRVRYFGNVRVGDTLTLDTLRSMYSGVVLSYGASADRQLGIPGEELVVPARRFVAWYNGLPEAQGLDIDLRRVDRVVIIGHGNVALDCARILLTDPSDLASTDITAQALSALRESNVKHVEMVGRRGPLQVAFTTKELREMTKIPHLRILCDRDLVASECEKWASFVDSSRSLKRMMDLLMSHAGKGGGEKSFTLSFLKSPVEVTERGVRFQVNRLDGPVDQAKAVGTGEYIDTPSGLVLRSVGYATTPIAGAPFDERRRIVPNIAGRVTHNGDVVPGLYAAGWAKRGPVGVIATTMQDAYRTGDAIIMDITNGHLRSGLPRDSVDEGLRESGVLESCVTNEQWKHLEAFEVEAGRRVGKPREKVTSVDRMLDIIGV
ncbi:NADPH-adrenodoxin reductase [Coemansia sp. IMI 209128]|nr:NADPH-adrenodoxin reductase [Coemansia sp. IMI 209128]